MRVRHARFIRAVLVIFLFAVSTFAVIAPRAVKAVSSSGLDGVGVNTTCQAGDGHCRSQLLTTTHGRDMLILIVLSRSNSTPQIRTSSDTFNFWYRLSYSPSTDPLAKVWEFYAVPLSSLNSENITVIDQCCFIKGGMQVFAVSGVSTGSNNGFDPNPSIPAKVSCPGDGCGTCQADYNTNPGPCSATIQTSTMDFVFATVAINDAPYCGGYPGSPAGYNPPAGFTNIASQSSSFEVDYSITSTPQTPVVFDCNGTDAQAIVLDAVTISAQSPTFNQHSSIEINGDSAFTADNGVTGGSGSSDDPYMIENWIISAYGNGITITNTAAWFIIQNVYVYPQSQIGDSGTAGLAFSNVTNGLVVNSRIEGFPEGFTTTPQGTASMASSYFTLADNTILGSTSIAIDLRGATNVEIQRNYVSNNPNYPYSSGLHVLYGNNVWAEDNTFHFAGNTAVFFGRSSNFSALGNSVVGNGQAGIQIYQSNSFEVTGNQISDYTGAGIDVSSSNANGLMITNNTVTNSKAGISLESSNGLFINGNTIDRNGIGIDANYPYVPYTGFTTITQNEITNNDVGILLNATHDTLIYQNSFVNNAVQAKDYQGTNNAWDNGSPGGGNYWSDYNGTDADMDGIGDTPYVFSYNQDNYPVMPVSIDGVETCPLCSFSQVLTTSHGNDLVILIVDDCAGCTISDSAGLTYTLRGSISEACVATGSCLTMTEYYAIATAPLQSDTVNVQNSPILVFALHSESNIQFDSASPSFQSCSVADQDQTPCSVSIATAKTDFIIGAVDNFPQSGCSSSAGLTPIVHGAFLGSGYQVQTQPELTSVSYTCIHRSGAYDTEFVMADAISLGP